MSMPLWRPGRSSGCRSRTEDRRSWSTQDRSSSGSKDEDRLVRASTTNRGALPAARQLGDERPRHRSAPRLPAARPGLDRRAAAAARPLEPTRPVRPAGDRPPALGGAEALRVARVYLADRHISPAARAHEAKAREERRRAEGARVHADERRLQAVRAERARTERPASLARAG